MKIHFREQYGTKGEEILYVTPADQKSIVRVPLKGDRLVYRERFALLKFFQGIFLPKGYPDSVSDDYLAYQIWDTIQAFCSTISGTLTTHAILKGIGVGSEVVTPLSATATWVLKEGTGHFGKILLLGGKGPSWISNPRNGDCGLMLSMIWRWGSKYTFSRTSFLGLYLLSVIKSQTMLYTVFVLVTLIHIYANIKAVKAVCLKTFNESRYLIALEEYFRSNRMLPPQKVNQLERVTLGRTVSVSLNIRMGLSAQNLVEQFKTSHDIDNIVSSFDPHEKFIIAESRKYLGVYLHFDTRPQDVLKAYFFAVSYLQDRSQLKERYWEVQEKWNEFLNMAQNEGWCTTNHLLYVDEYRLDWKV
ncbi:unnamed protein product [Hermetia illucens]|uniref:Uncharacterized protein n=1 Tax=Hermetia illucens TaxID=343691 RepID=A0A7R8UGG0_HERIL|nr:unnamed protein product [Hermetia illucens]